MELTDLQIRKLWEQHGGKYRGPHTETAYIEDEGRSDFLKFCRALIKAAKQALP